jgi:hypothetical protein
MSTSELAPLSKKKILQSSEEVWSQLSKDNSRSGSEISNIRVPIELEQSWDGVPENLSDILKRAQEAEQLGVQNVLESREELMDVKQFVNEELERKEIFDGIPHTDENLTAILNEKVATFIRERGSVSERVSQVVPQEGVIDDELEMLKAIEEMNKK